MYKCFEEVVCLNVGKVDRYLERWNMGSEGKNGRWRGLGVLLVLVSLGSYWGVLDKGMKWFNVLFRKIILVLVEGWIGGFKIRMRDISRKSLW